MSTDGVCGRGRGGGAAEERAEDGGGVGGQENEIFAHKINLIIKKLKGIHRRVIGRLISSRSAWSFLTLGHSATRHENLATHHQQTSHSHKCFNTLRV